MAAAFDPIALAAALRAAAKPVPDPTPPAATEAAPFAFQRPIEAQKQFAAQQPEPGTAPAVR